MTLVEYPNVVLWATGYLRTRLAAYGYPMARVADTYNGEPLAVWIQRDGGGGLDVIREDARLRLNCYAAGATSEPVDNFARRVSTLMRAAINTGPVRVVREVAGPTPIADANGIPRRYLLYDVTVVGSVLTTP